MTRADADAERRSWAVERLVPGGDGFLHISDGRAAFVTGAFPGDVIRPLAVEAKKGHVRATRFELLERSAHRVSPPCPVADSCGGCDWMGLERREQIVQKGELLRAALERTGGITGLPETIPVTAAGPDLGYRGRVRFHVDPSGRIGFFARGSQTVIPIPGCPVCESDVDLALSALRRAPSTALQAFSAIDVRCAGSAPRVSIRLVPRIEGGAGPAVHAVTRAVPSDWVVSVQGDPGREKVEQTFPLPGGTYLRAGAAVFTQVNWSVNVALVDAVVLGARERGVERFLDAYAGAGNFTIPLLAAGMRGTSIERDGAAVGSARAAARDQGLEEGGFVESDAVDVLAALARRGERFDLVLLDPPRSGARDVLGSVRRLAPPVIALCSCDPVTLARDVGTLTRGGYRLDSVRGFDMFPHTHHTEALAWLTRQEGGKGS